MKKMNYHAASKRGIKLEIKPTFRSKLRGTKFTNSVKPIKTTMVGFNTWFICLTLALLASCTSLEKPSVETEDGTIIVCVDYSDSSELKSTEITFSSKITALEALQKAAIVQTHPVGKYVFVSSIDGVKNIRGSKAWYYKVNNISPKVLAIDNPLSNGDTLLWIYKADVCSCTVDSIK